MNNSRTTLQERFKYMREEILNLSQQKLAENLNIKQQTIANIECGRKQKIDNDILQKLYEEYGIKLEWLLFDIGFQTCVDEIIDIQDTYINDYVIGIRKYDFKLSREENIKNNIEDDRYILYFDKRLLKNILGLDPNNIFFIYAPDDSMDSGMNHITDIKKNDILLIDISQRQGNDKVFVYKNTLDNTPTIRQIKWSFSDNIKVIPNNKKYKSEIIEKQLNEFIIEIVGRIIWNGSKSNVL